MKKAIITGASSGLGSELGRLLKKRGFDVVNVSRKESEFVDIHADLADDAQIEAAIKTIKKKHSDVDVLVLNAGIMPLAEVGKMDFDIDYLFRVNVSSSIKIVNALLGLLKKNQADIVFIGSTAALTGITEHSAYCATKHAVDGFLKSLQEELKGTGVRVIGFHPGGFNSNLRHGKMIEGYMDAKELAKLILVSLEMPKNIEVSEMMIRRANRK